MKNGVKNIQAAAYNGARTVTKMERTLGTYLQICCKMRHIKAKMSECGEKLNET